ncbi:uncharacterized protein LOC141905533 isoform X2 [Tubulanus polymorphus]|uniref:uncharacterized protein LOC141905533 isoform X2 n=1 Tax=Tubulanus polymorphus TaxID=672921 RepID=UPI003DA5293E
MPCWYYEKKDLRYTPSYKDNIDPETEARYRKEGARFIIDCGTKLGLRYDACSTGVVYFHRFYMFHSFKNFHRYVTGACCLFLAGKVEETPKKCKDIIRTASSMLTREQFAVFGNDPKEEVMTLERILLQTIKFDLQVSHPYHYLVKYAKFIKGDKEKVNSMIQMAWTFINDSMCTMLSLQWEPDIIGVSLLYLASRLSKFEITDWSGKKPGEKWWECFVPDSSKELLEDVCHQVLDLYTSDAPASKPRTVSPPIAPVPQQQHYPGPPLPDDSHSQNGTKQSRPATPQEPEKKLPPMPAPLPHVVQPPLPPSTQPGLDVTGYQLKKPETFSSQNPYISTQMYSNSFMSTEGAQSIQTLISSNKQQPPPAVPPTSAFTGQQPAPVQQYSQPAAGFQPTSTAQPGYTQQQGYPPPGYTQQAGYQYPQQQSQYPAQTQGHYNYPPGYQQQTGQYPTGSQQQYPAPPPPNAGKNPAYPSSQPPPNYKPPPPNHHQAVPFSGNQQPYPVGQSYPPPSNQQPPQQYPGGPRPSFPGNQQPYPPPPNSQPGGGYPTNRGQHVPNQPPPPFQQYGNNPQPYGQYQNQYSGGRGGYQGQQGYKPPAPQSGGPPPRMSGRHPPPRR